MSVFSFKPVTKVVLDEFLHVHTSGRYELWRQSNVKEVICLWMSRPY